VNISDLTKYEDPTAMSLKVLVPRLIDLGNEYRCVITDQIGTQAYSQSAFITDVILSAKNQVNFAVYPNPANHVIHIEQQGRNIEVAQLFGLDGKLMQTIPIESGSNLMKTDHLPAGMYLLKLISERHESVTRVIIR
jgi:hypothetical protein